MKFAIYEIWTRARVIEAENESEAFILGEPRPEADLSLCNWHVVPVEEKEEDENA